MKLPMFPPRAAMINLREGPCAYGMRLVESYPLSQTLVVKRGEHDGEVTALDVSTRCPVWDAGLLLAPFVCLVDMEPSLAQRIRKATVALEIDGFRIFCRKRLSRFERDADGQIDETPWWNFEGENALLFPGAILRRPYTQAYPADVVGMFLPHGTRIIVTLAELPTNGYRELRLEVGVIMGRYTTTLLSSTRRGQA